MPTRGNKTTEPDPLKMANIELAFQNEDKKKRAAELAVANEELAFQNEEKEKRASELFIANEELLFQNDEKEKRAAELLIANEELIFQNKEKEKRAAELIIANKELAFQNEEKEKRASELIIANKELVFQNEEKEKRAAELIIANNELQFQNEEKEKRAAELVIANELYVFLSQINQTIVHSKDQQTVFQEACRIAVGFGTFKVAWISSFDNKKKKLKVIAGAGLNDEDTFLLTDIAYEDKDPNGQVIETGNFYLCNDIGNDTEVDWKSFVSQRGWRSCMVLPIRKSSNVVALLTIMAAKTGLFGSQEIALLNEAVGDISFALDVFEKEAHRKEMEDRVIHNEIRLKQAQAIAHYGNWEYDFSTGAGLWSDEACRIFGLSPNDNIQSYESWLSFIHPDDMDHVLKATKGGQKRSGTRSFHHRIIRRDGTVRHISSQGNFEVDKKGKLVGMHSVVHDITETKETEEALAQSEANLRQIVDLIPQSISVKDYNGKFVFINKSFASLYGLLPQQVINRTTNEITAMKGSPEQMLEEEREIILSGTPKTIPEYTLTDHIGEKRLLHLLKVPFTVAGTNESAVLAITMDITEQKRAEEERTRMMADIVQRNKDLEQFSYIISHNLRAPVANITGVTELLQMPDIDENDEKNFIRDLGASVKKLDDVIMDLNYILQLKNKENKEREAVKFSELLMDIKLSLNDLIVTNEVEIKSDFSVVDEIPTLKSYLHSIFLNLITNSVKYKRQDLQPVIEITSKKVANKILLNFKDNGLGIDLGTRGDQVFGLYKRFHSHVEGRGMGLFMVKTQVESMGGKISIFSEVNKGTEFQIEFELN